MDIQLLSGLGLPGLLFLLAFVFAQIALVELVKQVLARVGQVLQGLAVITLSAGLGAALGWALLQGLAERAGVELGRPWGGIVLGLVLALIASGWVSYRSRQAAARGVPADALGELLDALRGAGALERPGHPVPSVPAVVPAPDPVSADPLGPDDLRPMDEADVARTRDDWPDVPSLNDPQGPGGR